MEAIEEHYISLDKISSFLSVLELSFIIVGNYVTIVASLLSYESG